MSGFQRLDLGFIHAWPGGTCFQGHELHGTPRGLGYAAQAVAFDGTNDYMARGAGLTGASDSKLMTFSFWIRKQGSNGVQERIFASFDTLGGGGFAQLVTRVNKNDLNGISIAGENSAGTVILNVNSSSGSCEVADGWINCLWSCDLSNTAKRHLYIHDVSDLAVVTTYTNDTMDFTNADWSFGGDANGGIKMQADVADFALWLGAYIDFSTVANRRLFISSALKPVDLDASGGAIATLGTPNIFFKGPAADWPTNRGSGGDFTPTGTLTDASTSPSD